MGAPEGARGGGEESSSISRMLRHPSARQFYFEIKPIYAIHGWFGPWLVEASGRFEPPADYGQRSWKPKVIQAFGCPMPWSPKPNMLKYTMT